MEIMLVLAIAAVIIVMSVRYYQSASASQRANACVAYLQAVAAAADSLSEGTQVYSQITSSEIDAIVPRNEAVCNDSGSTLKYSAEDHIGVYIKLPEQACRLMIPVLRASKHWVWANDDFTLDASKCPAISKGNNIDYYRTEHLTG